MPVPWAEEQRLVLLLQQRDGCWYLAAAAMLVSSGLKSDASPSPFPPSGGPYITLRKQHFSSTAQEETPFQCCVLRFQGNQTHVTEQCGLEETLNLSELYGSRYLASSRCTTKTANLYSPSSAPLAHSPPTLTPRLADLRSLGPLGKSRALCGSLIFPRQLTQ